MKVSHHLPPNEWLLAWELESGWQTHIRIISCCLYGCATARGGGGREAGFAFRHYNAQCECPRVILNYAKHLSLLVSFRESFHSSHLEESSLFVFFHKMLWHMEYLPLLVAKKHFLLGDCFFSSQCLEEDVSDDCAFFSSINVDITVLQISHYSKFSATSGISTCYLARGLTWISNGNPGFNLLQLNHDVVLHPTAWSPLHFPERKQCTKEPWHSGFPSPSLVWRAFVITFFSPFRVHMSVGYFRICVSTPNLGNLIPTT